MSKMTNKTNFFLEGFAPNLHREYPKCNEKGKNNEQTWEKCNSELWNNPCGVSFLISLYDYLVILTLFQGRKISLS